MYVYVLLPAPLGDWKVAEVLEVANRADAKSATRAARRRYDGRRPLVVTHEDRSPNLDSYFGRAGVAIHGERF
jgi:hypothetical protein